MAASASDAHPYPIYNARYRVIFPLLDADGDLVTGATTPDSELSQDCGTFADATNEMTEIATSSGVYYLDLVAGELDTKSTAIIAKSATAGMKTTVAVLYPVRLPVIRTGTAQAGGASSITLDSSASAITDYYVGCYVNITNNSPANAQGQARRITAYNGSTKVATVEGTYGTNPSSASTFEVLATSEWAWRIADLQAAGGVASTQSGGRPEVNATHWAGSAITATSIPVGTAAGASGGLLISGSNSGTTTLGALTVTGATTLTGNVSMAAGLNITQSSANTSALVVTGNGTGHGVICTSGSGATGDGFRAISAATNGNGFSTLGTGSGEGMSLVGGATGAGLEAIGGGTSGAGIRALAQANNAAGFLCEDSSVGGGFGFLASSSAGTPFRVTGALAITGTATIGALTVSGATTLTGAVSLGSTLGVTGAITATNASNNLRLGTFTVDTNAIAWNASWDAEVQSEVDDALVAKFLDKLVTVSGTADSGSTTTMVDAARTEGDNDYWKGALILFTSGVISGQCRIITDFVAATDTFTFAPPLTQAVGTETYVILPGISVWDDTLAEHLISGSTGSALNAAGSAGDPWATALPGAYGAGTAGRLIGRSLPDVVAGGAGGLLIAGSNAATTFATLTSTGAFTINGVSNVAQTGDSFARLGAPAGASVSADIAAIEAQTDDIGVAGAGLTAVPWNASWDAEVQSEVDDALVAQRLDELLNADSDIDGAAPPTVGSVFHELMTKTTGSFTFDQTTDSLEAIRDRGDAAWITATGFSTHSAADVWTAGTRTLTAATNITSTGGTTVPQTGDSFARLGAPAGASVSADIADLPTNAELATSQAAADDATLAAIAALSIPTAAQNATAVLTTQMTEAYAANGVAPTLAQAIFALHGYLMTFAISGTSYTVKKLDGATTAFIVTINDATSPTGATRS